jgi:hypothetical protein
LSNILQKASPDDARDAWSYEDLQKAVQRSRQAWESKERLGRGKPQKLFHSLMQKFDMHSTLFQIFPSSNTYTSLVAGAATVLVKVSSILEPQFYCSFQGCVLILRKLAPPSR